MSDEKDAVRAQIEHSTKEWVNFMIEMDEDFDSFSHEMGRTQQDTIATNRTVEACIQCILQHAKPTFDDVNLLNELEKLKK